MTGFIACSTEDGILTIRFNRPEKKNALLTGMYSGAAAALRDAAAETDVRVVVITGTGDSFTAGNDLKDFLANPPAPDAPVFAFMHTLAAFPKPVVAAVNGLAIGIGTTLLLHCDLAYAVPGAVFQLPFVNLAVVPEFASSLLLPRLVGHARAAELLMLGETFTAARACELGLINDVIDTDRLMPTARAKAAALAAKPPAALRQAKALLRGDGRDVAACIEREARAFGACLASPEFKEAASAFLEKRVPVFPKS